MLHLFCLLIVLFCSPSYAATELRESGTSKGYVNVLDFVGPTVSVSGIVGTVATGGGSSPWDRNAPYTYLHTSTDNVGIGTSSPEYKLTTAGEITAKSFILAGCSGSPSSNDCSTFGWGQTDCEANSGHNGQCAWTMTGSSYCLGDPCNGNNNIDCGQYGNEGDCLAVAGCGWDGSNCFSQLCSFYDGAPSSCNAVSGCSAPNCSTWDADQANCEANRCSFTPDQFQCVGTYSSCLVETSSYCATVGCTYDQSTSGTIRGDRAIFNYTQGTPIDPVLTVYGKQDIYGNTPGFSDGYFNIRSLSDNSLIASIDDAAGATGAELPRFTMFGRSVSGSITQLGYFNFGAYGTISGDAITDFGQFSFKVRDTGSSQFYDALQLYPRGSIFGEDYNVTSTSVDPGAALLVKNAFYSHPNVKIVKHSSQTSDLLQFLDTDGSTVLTNFNSIGRAYIGVSPWFATVSGSSSITPTSDTSDIYMITALSANATINAPSGTPTDGQKLIIRIKDDGSARTLTWNAIYNAVGVTLPATTTVGHTHYIGCIYNSQTSKWDVLAVGE